MMAVIFLQMRLVWNLQMARGQKIGVIVLFASGFVCVGFATLRVIQIGITIGSKEGLLPSWIALWTVVEGAMVIVIGCCPAFAILFHKRAPQKSYDTNGYLRHDQSTLGMDRRNTDAIKMKPVLHGTSGAQILKSSAASYDNSSQEELAAPSTGIMVTTTVEQEHRESQIGNNGLGKWLRNDSNPFVSRRD